MGKSIVEQAKADVKARQDKAKAEEKSKKKEENIMKLKSIKEPVKTIVITVLITSIVVGIIAFMQGANYERGNIERIEKAAQAMAENLAKQPSKQ